MFTQLYPATNTLRPISLWRAILIAGSYPQLKPPPNVETYPLKELCQLAAKNRWGPIVVFPEVSDAQCLKMFLEIRFNVVYYVPIRLRRPMDAHY